MDMLEVIAAKSSELFVHKQSHRKIDKCRALHLNDRDKAVAVRIEHHVHKTHITRIASPEHVTRHPAVAECNGRTTIRQ